MSINNITDLEKAFQDLQDLSDTQFKQIQELKKLNLKLKEEVDSLKLNKPNSTTESNHNIISLLSNQDATLPENNQEVYFSDEELACKTQIYLLKNRAVIQELSFEEAKKLQIYTTILEGIEKRKQLNKKDSISVEKYSDEELIKLVENGINTSS